MRHISLLKHLEAYESTPEEWQIGHEEAVLCFDVQDSLQYGLLILAQINELDESIRLDGFEKKISSEVFAGLARDIEDLYRKWLTASSAPISGLLLPCMIRDIPLREQENFKAPSPKSKKC